MVSSVSGCSDGRDSQMNLARRWAGLPATFGLTATPVRRDRSGVSRRRRLIANFDAELRYLLGARAGIIQSGLARSRTVKLRRRFSEFLRI